MGERLSSGQLSGRLPKCFAASDEGTAISREVGPGTHLWWGGMSDISNPVMVVPFVCAV